MLPAKPDYSNQHGSAILARRIKGVWIGRGYCGIKATSVRITDDASKLGAEKNDHGEVYAVRTNIGPDGFPPRGE